MLPRLRSTLPLHFAEDLSFQDFERLCRDLVEKEPHVDAATLYGRLPQGQKGVDILVYHRDDGGSDVVQCKNYRRFTKSHLQKAIKEFETARQHWHEKGIRRFLLCIGGSSSDTTLQNEILKQRQKFALLGLAFDVWDDATLTSKLTKDRAIALRHLDKAVVDQICPPVESITGIGTSTTNLLQATLEECGNEFEQTLETELPRLRELTRSGHIDQAFASLEELRTSPRWPLLDSISRARALRLAASLYLDFKDDVIAARKLMNAGKQLDAKESFQVVEAAIAVRDDGVGPALKILATPHDLQAWNFRLAILFEEKRWPEIIAAVVGKEFPPNAASYRLVSMAFLQLRNLAEAQRYSNLALESSPSWFEVRFQAARMDYVSALLPHFPMLTHIAWPIPPDLEYVRRDAESVVRLRNAALEFAALAQLESRERRSLETWHLACVANLPDGYENAVQLAAELLAKAPDHLPVAVWCLQRNFRVEREILLKAFGSIQTSSTPDSVQAVCQLHIQSGDYEAAIAHLRSAQPIFVAAGAEFVWRHMRAQLAAAVDKMDEARKVVAEETDEEHRRDIEVAITRVQARRSGDILPLARATNEAYAASKNPKYLFAAVEASLEAGDVRYVMENADELLRQFPTAGALKIVLKGSFAAGRFQSFLRWLRQHRPFFAEGAVPMSVRRMEVESLWQVGEFNAALRLAHALVQESKDTENLFALFGAQVAFADMRACAQTGRDLIARSDVSNSGLLHLSRTIYIEDVRLAREGLKTAIQRGLNGDEIVTAVYLGFQIGAEAEIAPLMGDFCRLAHKPEAAVKAFSLPEIKEMMRDHAQHRDHVWRVYGQGQVPVHSAAKALNIELAILYREQPRIARESEQPLRDTPTLIRAGSRHPVAEPKIARGDLFMDVTSVLVAADQELLDAVEKAFSPIHISTHLLDSLRRQTDGAAPHQPSRHITRDEVVKLVDKKRLRATTNPEAPAELLARYESDLGERWCGALARVLNGEAWLCGFTPPISFTGIPAAIMPEHVQHLVSGADIVCALHCAGAISEDERESMLSLLGDANTRFQPELKLTPNSIVALDFGLAEVLSRAGALQAAADFLTIEIDHAEVAQLREESEAHVDRLKLVDWLRSLTERIQRGLAAGIYCNAPRAEATDESNNDSFDEKCVRDLLAAKAHGAKVVWCDDRWLSRYEHAGELPNYGVSEILKTLRSEGHLSTASYFDALLRLRASNFRYIPLEKEELLHHLLRAPLTTWGLQETPALTILRRYTAACALDRFRLHPPAQDEQGRPVLAEFTLGMENQRAAAYALAGLWEQSSLADYDRSARAEWLLNQVLAPMSGFAEAHSGLPHPHMADGIATELAVLFAVGFEISWPTRLSRDQSHPRARFYHYLGERLFDPLLRVEPQVTDLLAKILVRDVVRRNRRILGLDQKVMRRLVLRWLLDLPDSVLNSLSPHIPKETWKWLGLTKGTIKLSVFGHTFEWEPFWQTVICAIKGSASVVRSEDDTEFQFRPPAANQPIYRVPVVGPGLKPGTRLVEPVLRAVTGSPAQQRAYLNRRSDWLDLPQERRRLFIEKIARAKNPIEGIKLLESARSGSTENFYRRLLHQLRRDEPPAIDEHMHPAVEMLCRHLRMREEPDFVCRACRLIREVGLAGTIERFATLPITLPEPILAAVQQSTPAKRRSLISRLRRRLRTPLGRLHIVHLLAHIAEDESAYLLEAKKLIAELLDTGRTHEQWKTFRVLLEWTRRFFLSRRDFRRLDAQTLLTLTWLHAGRLHQTLEFGRADDGKVHIAFTRATEALGLVADHSHSQFWQDASHPRRASRIPVVLRGLGAAIATLPAPVAEALRQQVVQSLLLPENLTSSAARLLRETSGLPNALGSFLGGDSWPLLESACGQSTLTAMMPQSPSELITAALADLQSAPDNWDAWGNAIVSAADHLLPDDTCAKLDQVLASLNLKTLFRMLQGKEDELLPFLAVRAALTNPDRLREQCEEHLFVRAHHSAAEKLDDQALEKRVAVLASSLILVSVVPNDESATYERMHKMLVRLIQAWPSAAPVLRRRFDGWPTNLPTACQRGFWELEMTLRSIR